MESDAILINCCYPGPRAFMLVKSEKSWTPFQGKVICIKDRKCVYIHTHIHKFMATSPAKNVLCHDGVDAPLPPSAATAPNEKHVDQCNCYISRNRLTSLCISKFKG